MELLSAPKRLISAGNLTLGLVGFALASTARQESMLPTQPQLISAITSGDLEAAEQLLRNGETPDCHALEIAPPSGTNNSPGGKISRSESALHLAVRCRSIRFVKLLLDYKANPNIRSHSNWTPLMAACQNSDHDVAKLLLSRGAKPNLLNEHREAAINYAANAGSAKCVELLLNAGADQYAGATSALEDAVRASSTEVVRLLLDRKADPNRHRKGSRAPLEIALLGNDKEIIAMLRKAGAKGRPLSVILREPEEELARWEKKWPQEKAARPKRDGSRAKLLPSDGPVLQMVLDRLTKEVWSDKGEKAILVAPMSRELIDPEEQMDNEISGQQRLDLDLWMRKDWLDRNSFAVSLEALPLKHVKFGERKEREYDQPTVSFSLPGYSKDGSRALVRFRFGPSAHGAAGTAFVVTGKNGLVVKWIKLAYYA